MPWSLAFLIFFWSQNPSVSWGACSVSLCLLSVCAGHVTQEWACALGLPELLAGSVDRSTATPQHFPEEARPPGSGLSLPILLSPDSSPAQPTPLAAPAGPHCTLPPRSLCLWPSLDAPLPVLSACPKLPARVCWVSFISREQGCPRFPRSRSRHEGPRKRLTKDPQESL